MNKKHFISIIAIAGSIGLFATTAEAQRDRTVDCDSGDSIQAALDRRVGHTGIITIDVIGTCTENVNIARDDVTISGNFNATVVGTIHISNSNRITLWGITVTGPGHAIEAFGSNVTLSNVTITENQGWTAIRAGNGGNIDIHTSNISNNNGDGVHVGPNTSLTVSNNTVINNNSGSGINLFLNSSTFVWSDVLIQGNHAGINAATNSGIVLEDVEVSNNNIGIHLVRDSSAQLRTGVTISGSGVWGVYCDDTESSYENDSDPITDPVSCTDFNQ